MQLAHAVCRPQSDQPALYVFSHAGSPGFCILAADDAIGDILLGYSDSSAFDPADIPSGMQWLLDAYAARVSVLSVPPAPRVGRSAIAPLASTKWAQDSPYNALCPEIGGSRAAAGCVAIAMAQLLKVHQWPEVGAGYASYDYTLNDGGGESVVSVESDFSSHAYQWQDMLDSYVGLSTASQREAVALLVSDCGVACETEYAATSSSTPLKAGKGMLEHFGYDKSMRYLKREWFAYGDWEDMVYAQLAAGRPVIYSGSGPATAHSFLIDGADGDGFFHFNWGWFGVADGYYSLADLSPVDPGDEVRPFNTEQNMLLDIMPDAGSPLAGNMAIADVLMSNKSVYKSDTDFMNLLGGFYSFALGEMQYSIGFMADTDPPKYISAIDGKLDTAWGYTQIAVFGGYFPEGEYDVYPVYRTPDGEWHKMYFDRRLTSGCLHFVNDGNSITVSGGDVPVATAGGIVEAELADVVPHDGLEPRLFAGHGYDFIYGVAVDGECQKAMHVVLAGDSGEVVAAGRRVVVDFSGPGALEVVLPLELADTVAHGKYLLACVVAEDGADRIVSGYAQVEVLKEWIALEASSLDMYIGEEYLMTASSHSDRIPMEWTSSDAGVAEVDASGMITARSEGTASITARCGGVSASCDVSVRPVYPDSIVVSPSRILIGVGRSIQLDVMIYPANTTDKTVVWTYSQPGIVEVDDSGVLTGLSHGYVTFTATCGGVSTECHASSIMGIDDVEADEVSVGASEGRVLVTAPEGMPVSVHSIDGSLLYRGESHDIPLPQAGVYVVIVGGDAFKIIVD